MNTDRIRRAELAKIHIAKSELGMDDASYRDMLWTLARVKSSKDLDSYGRACVLEHMKSRGFIGGKTYRGRPHNTDSRAQMQKIEALLTDMQLPWSYADGCARNMFHVERVAWCQPDQLQKIIAALTYKQRRDAKKKLADGGEVAR